MENESLLFVEIGSTGVRMIRLMAYSKTVERKADQIYRKIKRHLDGIDQTLSPKAKEAGANNRLDNSDWKEPV